MSKKETQNNFIMQAGILAAAGIITRIIGLLYRGPLNSVIGSVGLGYYSAAYSYYTIVLLISSYSIPSAISKVIAQKLALKEYRNAHRIFWCALGYVLVVGAVASLFLFFGAGMFVEENAIPVLRAFAPTIFVYGILGVLRGYFQAHKSMVQTSVSQILEQIANAVISIGGAYLLIYTAMGTMDYPTDVEGEVTRAVNGAIGSALGTGMGVVVALIFMVGMYLLNRGMIQRRIKHDRHAQVDSYGSIIKMITMVVTPFILSTAIYNLIDSVNTKIYTSIYPNAMNLNDVVITSNWGLLSQAQTISKIPIAFASAMAAAMMPTISQMIAAKDFTGSREKIGVAVKTTMVISIPCAMGVCVLAKPLTNLLFHSNSESELELSSKILMTLSLSVVFYALSTLNNTILQGVGKLNAPIINAGISLVVQTIVVVVLLFYTDMDIYSVAVANTVYSGLMCILNQWSVRKAVGYKQEMLRTFGIPFLAATLMGAGAWAIYQAFLILTDSMVIAVIPAIIVAVIIYFVMLLLMRGLTEQELRGFPKGYLLVKAAKKCKLM